MAAAKETDELVGAAFRGTKLRRVTQVPVFRTPADLARPGEGCGQERYRQRQAVAFVERGSVNMAEAMRVAAREKPGSRVAAERVADVSVG